MTYWALIGLFLGISAIFCAIGFKRFVYFLSIGYGFSVAALGVSYFVYSLVTNTWDVFTIIFSILFVVYGARLSGFLIYREIKNASYRKILKDATKEDTKPMPFFVKVIIWVTVAVLYFAETAGVFFKSYNALNDSSLLFRFNSDFNLKTLVFASIGAVVSIFGIILESMADRSKTNQKKLNPNMVATKGLYKMVRCPNYLGEIVFWTGVFVASIGVLNSLSQWLFCALGYISIVYVMFNSAKRLEKRQEKRYGKIEMYREYADHTPILIPLIPLYHLIKIERKN